MMTLERRFEHRKTERMRRVTAMRPWPLDTALRSDARSASRADVGAGRDDPQRAQAHLHKAIVRRVVSAGGGLMLETLTSPKAQNLAAGHPATAEDEPILGN